MIMVHKAAQLPTPPAFQQQHRRAPSAPAMSVQPTKTPGLLSLSKPAAPAKSQRQQRSPKLKAAQAAAVPQQRSPKQAPAQAHPVHAPTTTSPSAGSPTPEQRPRGRQHHGKDNKGRRNTSNSPAHRNPSLPENAPAQTAPRRPAARRPQSFAAPKGSDPFLVPASDLPSVAPAAGKSIRPTPALSAQPSGKLARRRRPSPDSPTPAHAKAVPIPHVTSHPGLPLSRSAPTNVTRPGPRRSTSGAVPDGIAFPVCDDTAEDDDEPAYRRFDDGLRTAPQATFGFPNSPSPRIRSSSGGFMSGSFDEEYLNTPVDDVRTLLFGLSPAPAFPQSFVPKDLRFANSQFQNSPDPDDLPSL